MGGRCDNGGRGGCGDRGRGACGERARSGRWMRGGGPANGISGWWRERVKRRERQWDHCRLCGSTSEDPGEQHLPVSILQAPLTRAHTA